MRRDRVRTSRRAIYRELVDVNIRGRGDYAIAHAGGARHTLHLSLSRLANRLDSRRFVRVPRTHIVNLDQVRAFKRDCPGNLEAEMLDGARVPVSRARAQEIRSLGR